MKKDRDSSQLQPRDGSKRNSMINFLQRQLSRISTTKLERDFENRNPFGLNVLHEPAEPYVDFIFVHGLGGGSFKTWSFSENPDNFWPRKWLPHENGFEHVRIQSYGYNSLWDCKGAVTRIHDFGQRLLTEIYGVSAGQKNGHIPIVFIGHSMGGIVIKKAYLLAKQDPNFLHIAKRFHTIFFLATPHRGADSAAMLKNILRIPGLYGSKDYVDELVPGSMTLQVINDGFRHEDKDLRLWSFFETIEMNMGHSRQIIVGRDSAILAGSAHERVSSLDADHRNICKFKSSSDSNYKVLRTSLLTSVREIQASATSNQEISKQAEYRTQMKAIAEYLCILQDPEVDLSTVLEKQSEGSCGWLTNKPDFRLWLGDYRDNKVSIVTSPLDNLQTSRYFWLCGQPGTGKSISAGHTVRYIRAHDLDCSFFFFKYGDKTRSSIPELLKSLAYQMALSSAHIRQSVLEMVEEGDYLNKDDASAIWRNVFLSRIFRSASSKPHIWIIDGLDECSGYSNLFPLLSKIDEHYPLKVFITSRFTPSIEKQFTIHHMNVLNEQITVEDSWEDIQAFLRVNSPLLPVDDETIRNTMISQILQKANGCFLWAALVLKELETAHSIEQITSALDDVPTGMEPLYTQILKKVAADTKNLTLAKAILRWTICAARPLTVEELNAALYLETDNRILCVESITSICGHFVYVDHNARVQMAHQTVRPFFTSQCEIHEFRIKKRAENTRLAKLCLSYLCSEELQTSRTKGRVDASQAKRRSPFAQYACFHFSDHLAHSDPTVEGPLLLLNKFLKSNVLTWIEILACSGDLSVLTRTAKNFELYLAQRVQELPLLGKEIQTVDAWVNDLIHISALFGYNLLKSPSSIHYLTPPMCPPASRIYKSFGVYESGLRVTGIREKDWDDRLTCFIYPGERTESIACSDSYFAVGLSNGKIILYRSGTLEYVREMDHGGPPVKLAYAHVHPLLASSSVGKIIIWNTQTGAAVWTTETLLRLQPLALSFNEDDSRVMLALENSIAMLRITDGYEWDNSIFFGDNGEEELGFGCSAVCVRFSLHFSVLAASYRQKPIIIWDLERNRFHGRLVRDGCEGRKGWLDVNDVAFHPNPEAALIAVAYNDGYLVVFDVCDCKQLVQSSIQIQALTASLDGRTLAAGDLEGNIHIFNFETLKLIYRVQMDHCVVKGMVFHPNGLRFFDIRGDLCNVWEPSVLVRRKSPDDSSSEPYSEESSAATCVSTKSNSTPVSAIVDHHEGEILFCGRSDGSIAVYDASSGEVVKEVSRHQAGCAIHLLDWNPRDGVLTAADTSSRFVSRKVVRSRNGIWQAEAPLLDYITDSTILQILSSPDGRTVLVVTVESDLAWDLDGEILARKNYEEHVSRKWITHPSNPDHLLLLKEGNVYIFDWLELDMISAKDGILLDSMRSYESCPHRVVTCQPGNNLCVNYSTDRPYECSSELEIWDAATGIHPDAQEVFLLARYTSFASKIKAIIGVHKSLLIFLDTNLWVCSIDIGATKPEHSYFKHFFIPFTWYRTGDLTFQTTTKGGIVFAHEDGIVIFRGWLDHKEELTFE
ncbi:hypothetical protein AJ80_06390 [Polytolypa hystricis UAMH7299]|uniref:Uncharacterized protein n=1 Tax=Polytolypa hystricis (strain UAMH7299) TaxID=1447883 RepID=A0A2B7XW96_POLH7|nr:hypothetical protein AJ80_06390 [Polytolypa hystricis UAMH7299]